MLEYPALAALAAVVREGSFERAAASLHVTPSAVSQRVRALEERLGAILVVRGQPCTATSVGARLCAHFDRVMLLEGDLLGRLPKPVADAADARLTIRIGVNGDSLGTWFPAAAALFARTNTALLDLVLDGEDQTADRLRSGEVLAAVTADPSPVQGCRTVGLGSLRYLAVASPDLFDRHFRQGIDERSLSRAPMLRTDRNDALQARWARTVIGTELTSPTHWAPSTQGFIDLILSGLGWGMAPELIARKHLSAGRLIELNPGATLDVELFWQYSRLYARVLADLNRAVVSSAKAALIST